MNKFMLRRLGVADDPGGSKPTLAACMDAVLEQSGTLMDEVLAALQASLVIPKGKQQAISHGNVASDAIDALVANRKALKESFSRSLRAAVYGGEAQRKISQPLVRFDDFQFLDEEQIDANIEFALTQQEVLLAVEDVLPSLNAFISTLLGWVTVQGHLNPLKPEVFVYALRESIQEQLPDDDTRAAVITMAAGKLGLGLRQLYKEVTDWLRSQGIEPAATAGGATGLFGAAGKPAETSVSRTMLTLDKLRRLLSGELDPGPQIAGAAKDFTHTVPASFVALEDMKLMEPMMKRLAERAKFAKVAQAAEAKAAINRGEKPPPRETKQTRKLGRELGEEVVRLMLENLMQDRRLLAAVRSGLKSMETVLINLSQSDPRFFSDRQHPARQFLDKITSRSLAFTSEDEPGFARFQKTFENAVSVLVGGDGDAATFARVLRKLEEGWAKDEHDQRARAEEAARGLLHAEQRNLIAERLKHEFDERLQNKSVPEIVVHFLRGPWAQAVAEAQLRGTDGSDDADGYLGMVDDLIWSVQLRLARRNRSRLMQIVPGMLVRMRQGLQRIAYPEEKVASFFDELVALHEKAFEANPAAQTPGAMASEEHEDQPVEKADVAPDAMWMAEGEAADSGYLEDAGDIPLDFTDAPELQELHEAQDWATDDLNTGAWVDLALGGEWVRAQLTWCSPHRTLFMFTSGSGMAHSMSRRTMDRLHGQGLIRLVSDGHVMDNALDAVAQAALRNDRVKPADGT